MPARMPPTRTPPMQPPASSPAARFAEPRDQAVVLMPAAALVYVSFQNGTRMERREIPVSKERLRSIHPLLFRHRDDIRVRPSGVMTPLVDSQTLERPRETRFRDFKTHDLYECEIVPAQRFRF
jgi:hypothetical protein